MKKGLISLMLIFIASFSRPLSSFASPVTVNANDTVVFDLSQATCNGTYVKIPVSILSDDTIYTLDFSFKFDHANLAYDSIAKNKNYLNSASSYNTTDSTLRFTSFAFQQIDTNTALVSVYFNLLSGEVSASFLNSINVYLNGDPCSVKIIDAIPSSGIAAGGPTTFTTGDSVSLNAAAGAGYSYLWSTGATSQSIYARSAGTYSVSITNTSGCSTVFSMSISVVSPLPVQLIDFQAKREDDGVLISWTTASEINNNYFSVERSSNGNVFQSIETVKGAGNSIAELHYSSWDNSPLNGISYYRLRQTDYDKNSVTSKPIAVNFYNNESNMINIYPNPASDIVYVNVNWQSMSKAGVSEADFMLRVFDSNGHLALPSRIIHLSYGMLQSLDVSVLPKGVYIIQLSNDFHVQEQKLLVE